MPKKLLSILIATFFALELCPAAEVFLIEDLHPGWFRCQDDKVILGGGSSSSYPLRLRVLDAGGQVVHKVDTNAQWYDALLAGDTIHGVALSEYGVNYGIWKAGTQLLDKPAVPVDSPIHKIRMVDTGAEYVLACEVSENPKSGVAAHLLLARLQKSDGKLLWSQKIRGHARFLYAESEKSGTATVLSYGTIDEGGEPKGLEFRSTRVSVRPDGSTKTMVKSFTSPSDRKTRPTPSKLIKADSQYLGLPSNDEADLFIATVDFDEGAVTHKKLPEQVRASFVGITPFVSDGKQLYMAAIIEDYATLVTTSLTGEVKAMSRISDALIKALAPLGWTPKTPGYTTLVHADRPFFLVADTDELAFDWHGGNLYVSSRMRKIDKTSKQERHATAVLKISN